MTNDSFLANQRTERLQDAIELTQMIVGIVQCAREIIPDSASQRERQPMGPSR